MNIVRNTTVGLVLLALLAVPVQAEDQTPAPDFTCTDNYPQERPPIDGWILIGPKRGQAQGSPEWGVTIWVPDGPQGRYGEDYFAGACDLFDLINRILKEYYDCVVNPPCSGMTLFLDNIILLEPGMIPPGYHILGEYGIKVPTAPIKLA